ncbi:MAG: [protein-PII] uridylyltransferase [Alphaproteobacteria bacterium]
MDQRLAVPPFFDPGAMRETLDALWLQHGDNTLAMRAELLALLKELVKEARSIARKQLEVDGSGRRCAHSLSIFQDELLRLIFWFATKYIHVVENPSEAERMSVVATGGYGRELLAPGSDIDLLFLLPYKQTPWGESVAEYILYMLWDLGFKVGHATRSIGQNIRFAKTDITTRTALLDARPIIGDEAIWKKFETGFHEFLLSANQREYITAKLDERDSRHDRGGNSRYKVEPDIKEGKGGLRDLHTLHWIAKHLHPGLNSENFVENKLFSPDEFRMYQHCEDFLWTVRCHLHFQAGKPEERLSFDLQLGMADRLHYRGRKGLRAVERFMKHYFLIAKDVGDLTRILCSSLEVKQLKKLPIIENIAQKLTWRTRVRLSSTSDFRIENGRITVKSRQAFQNDPVNLIRMFALAKRNNVQFHPEAIRLVRHSLKLIDDNLRNNATANRLFLEVLTSRTHSEIILRRMNEAGVLGRFIPEFGQIVSMMQFNMYHHYTVDEHLIRTVGILSAIERGALESELPLSTEIIRTIENRRALYLAAFLHDVAKGRDEDHSIAGARVIREVGKRLGLGTAEVGIAEWLVKHHLVMSQFAQSRDLNDPKTIQAFANIAQSREQLMLLVILTAVDIRAVGPGVWTGWKGQLLRELYAETEPLVTGGYTALPREMRVKQSIAAFRQALADELPSEEIDALIARQDRSYWLRTDHARQIAHANLIRKATAAPDLLNYDISTDATTSLTELQFWTSDRSGLVAIIAGACAAAEANIVGANLTTTRDGMALNSFFLQRTFNNDEEEIIYASRIAQNIEMLLNGERNLSQLNGRQFHRSQSRLEAFTVDPRVSIDNSLSDELTVVEVTALDRPGLLHEIAQVLSAEQVEICSAHIATFGEKAVDVFYVTGANGKKITQPNIHKRVREKLLEAFENGDTSKAS